MHYYLPSGEVIVQENEFDCWKGIVYIPCATIDNLLHTTSSTLANVATSGTTASTTTPIIFSQLNKSDVLTFERMNNTDENVDNNNMNRDIIQDKPNNNDAQSIPLYYECTYLEPCSTDELSRAKAQTTFKSMYLPPPPAPVPPPRSSLLNIQSHSNRHHNTLPEGTFV
ncbi:unnamed protein product [Adineta steineri]|uniref:Uncharacterized protein n=1 Tax=Adineta steineri TaxID=433720 RepID=A0A819XMU2_9BILA|nr:unnamed protein product [Adineta steineri]